MDNELIAEFMDQHVTLNGLRRNVMTNSYYADELEYDISWDWLMPVVEKIDKLTMSDETHFRTNINGSRNRTHCYIHKYHPGMSVGKEVSEGHEDSKLSSVYKAVVGFIKWHNVNKL